MKNYLHTLMRKSFSIFQTSGSKSTSGRQIGRQRKIEKYVTSSSEEDNAPTAVSKKRGFVN